MEEGRFYTVSKPDLARLLGRLAKEMDVHVPVRNGKTHDYGLLKPGQAPDLEGYSNTQFPPRSILLPEGETLLEYDARGMRESLPQRKALIFGIRPCDVHALLVLDRVMLGHEYFETHYKARRENTLVFALACLEPGENCFCDSMGTRELVEGFDLLFTDRGDSYHVEAGSERGEAFIEGNKRVFMPTTEKVDAKVSRCRKSMDTSGLPEIMEKTRDSNVWKDLAKRCLSCASCTFSCPTCYCFSLVHDTGISDLKKGRVKRELDYCMLLRYSRIAGGAVFREDRAARIRQFFMHKLLYGKTNEGLFHCVGCGRCITECMAKIDITEEAGKLRKEYVRKHGRKG
jgi:heterodisulfide reductase subunit C